jgi:zinc transport system substrate-binding protein
MNFFQKSIFFGLSFLFYSFAAQADVKTDIKVVTTIKPLHSLISRIMESRGEPQLIIEGTNNPHTFVFKPSHAEMLEEADIVFWIGEDLEAFMEKPLDSLAKNAKKIAFMESDSIEKLRFREENIFDDHDDHDDHDGHKDDDHDDHDDHDGHEDEHEGHDDHNHGEFDAHIWLDPENAKEMVKIIRDELIKIDPEGQRQYSVNTAGATLELDNLINNVEKELSKDISYVVFHDAYQYFETRFGVTSAGALTLNPDVLPGARQIADIQDLIRDKGIKCIFSEPQYNPKIIETLGNDMNISTGVMDPLGAFIDAGPTMYVELINGITNSIKECH